MVPEKSQQPEVLFILGFKLLFLLEDAVEGRIDHERDEGNGNKGRIIGKKKDRCANSNAGIGSTKNKRIDGIPLNQLQGIDTLKHHVIFSAWRKPRQRF